MPQTPYEVVRRALEFDGPDRLPVRFESLGMCDTHYVGWNQIGTGDHAQAETVDEWGCGWARSDVANMGQVKGHPLADWSALDSYRWPDPDDPVFYAGMEARFAGAEDRYITTSIFMLLFERMHSLRGFENLMLDLVMERERVEALADRIVATDLAIIKNIGRRFPGQIHGLTFTDDWGTQQALFVSPALWDEFFKPRYKRLFEAIHAQGWHVWMHSCGRVNAILESLLEIGVDSLNLQQPRALGIEAIGAQFRGRVCFESLCDIQATLPHEDAAAIRAEVALLLEHWAAPDGGFILSDYGDGAAIGVPLEKKHIMLEAFLAQDPFLARTRSAAEPGEGEAR